MWLLFVGVAYFLQIHTVQCGGTVGVRLITYEYLINGNQTKVCCDIKGDSSCDGCDPYIEITLAEQSNFGTAISNTAVTRKYNNTYHIDFNATGGSFDLSFNEFQPTYFLILRVFDTNNSNSKVLLDELHFPVGQGEPSRFNSNPGFTSGSAIGISTKMQFEYIIQCNTYYYGNCHAYCRPVPGQYKCDSQAHRVCEPGWSGINCTIHTIDLSCKNTTCVNGATCVNTAVNVTSCLCPTGYTGQYCEIMLSSTPTTLFNSVNGVTGRVIKTDVTPSTSITKADVTSVSTKKGVTLSITEKGPIATNMQTVLSVRPVPSVSVFNLPTLSSLTLTNNMGTLQPDTTKSDTSTELTGVIGGSVLGFILLLAVVIGVTIYIWKKNQRKVKDSSTFSKDAENRTLNY